jgi:hypothetical protein
MMTESVEHLVQEVHDLLDVSSVGLYEFLEILNTPDQPLTIDERKSVARQALLRLLDEPGMELVWLRWPEFGPVARVTLDQLPDDPWAEPDAEGLYVAVDRIA